MEGNSAWLAEILDGEMNKEELREQLSFNEELIKSVEGLLTGKTHTLFTILKEEKYGGRFFKEIVESSLDNAFCHALVNQIPAMVLRALQLEPLVVSELPSGPVNIYLREATRAYLLGLFIASMALSRSALEQALEEKVPRALQTDSKEEKLKKLIKAAGLSKLLQGETLCMADEVRKSANKVVHGETCRESKTFDILVKVRTLVKAIYDSRN